MLGATPSRWRLPGHCCGSTPARRRPPCCTPRCATSAAGSSSPPRAASPRCPSTSRWGSGSRAWCCRPTRPRPPCLRLRRQLPPLLEDAQAAATRCDRYQRQATRARTDALTGLAERGEIDARLEQATGDDVVCLMDLDGFKAVNDTRGHAAGDRALRRFGQLLRSAVRDVDFVGRYGGDEFLLVFSGIPLAIAEERMAELVHAWATDGPGVGVSIGVAQVDQARVGGGHGRRGPCPLPGQAGRRQRGPGGHARRLRGPAVLTGAGAEGAGGEGARPARGRAGPAAAPCSTGGPARWRSRAAGSRRQLALGLDALGHGLEAQPTGQVDDRLRDRGGPRRP